MISATITLGGANAALDGLPPQVIEAVAKKVRALTLGLQRHIVADKLQGQVLHHRSGDLGRSIGLSSSAVTTTEGTTTTGEVWNSGDVKYAAIHEFGFHGIESCVSVLGTPFTRNVNYPERSFMRSSLEDHAEMIVAEIRAAAEAGAKQSLGG